MNLHPSLKRQGLALLGVAVLLAPTALVTGCRSEPKTREDSQRIQDSKATDARGRDLELRGRALEKKGDRLHDEQLKGEGEQMKREGIADQKAAKKMND